MEKVIGIIEASLHNTASYVPEIAISIIVLIILFLLGRMVGNLLLRFLDNSTLSRTHRNFFRKIIIWIFVLVGISISLNILNLNAASIGLLTGGGITALAFGIAFRDIGENILAGIYLAFSKPFKMGDLIATGDIEGEVKEVELRHTHIRTYDGIDVFIPNSQLFSQPLLNYTMDGLRRISFSIGIDYDDNAIAACILLTEKIQKVDHILKEPPCIASIVGFMPQYVEIKVYCWINAFNEGVDFRLVKSAVMDECRRDLKENGYTFSSSVQIANTVKITSPVEVFAPKN